MVLVVLKFVDLILLHTFFSRNYVIKIVSTGNKNAFQACVGRYTCIVYIHTNALTTFYTCLAIHGNIVNSLFPNTAKFTLSLSSIIDLIVLQV